MHQGVPIRMTGADVSVGAAITIAIRRRRLRQTRRVTDRAEVGRDCGNVIADGLQPFQYGLPLLPVELAKERAQSLNERIFQQRFSV